jgi:L-gulonate 3-dehydrogenase
MKDIAAEPWDDALIAKVEAARREQMPHDKHAEREAWRDRRLMALIAHKRDAAKKIGN